MIQTIIQRERNFLKLCTPGITFSTTPTNVSSKPPYYQGQDKIFWLLASSPEHPSRS